MRKILISFIGPTAYEQCNYYFDNDVSKTVTGVTYVQEAIVKYCCRDWGIEDRIFIFLTDKAKEVNWDPPGKLRDRLAAISCRATVVPVTGIPLGFAEEEIWDIFAKMVKVVEKNDEVYFDITNGFRSLPLLGNVLINYLKSVKNISVGQIYYGAFEKFLDGRKIAEIPLSERNAPIVELLSFDNLQEWSLGADVFVRYGVSELIEKAIEDWIGPLLRKPGGRDLLARQLRGLQQSLSKVPPLMQTVRGKELLSGEKIKKLCKNIKEIKETGLNFRALGPVLDKILEKFSDFTQPHDDIRNGFIAARWCLDHGMLQQGITLLQENIVSWICSLVKLDSGDHSDRDIVGQAFHIASQKIPKDKWHAESRKRPETSRRLQDLINGIPRLKKIYDNLSQKRNDINHGGYLKDALPSDNFRKTLSDAIIAVEKIIDEHLRRCSDTAE